MCSDYAIQWSGPNIRDQVFQSMMDWQRINHFPNSTELTRKDRLWLHFAQMAKNYGKGCFDFVPETYVLPDNFDAFLKCYQRSRCNWIVKPNASSCGRGIFILKDLSELPLDETVVVSRYIEDPLLIQGYKFDLRVYVLVTSYDPLKAYIYREGLTRFASAPYSTQEDHMQDAFRHLTNYSVNKNSNTFVENSDMRADNVGHKWSLSALNKHLRCVGADVNLMWVRIMDLIVKTLLSVEPAISSRTKQLTGSRENCFELYGFDVLVDSGLKPWLLEVNLSPSMQAESPLDWQIKSSLLADTFNLVGICSNEKPAPKLDRMRSTYSQPWKQGQGGKEGRKDDVPDIDDSHAPLVLNALSDANLKMLAKAAGERARCHNFVVLYPTRAAVKRYGMITEARAQQMALPRVGVLAKVNRCLSQSQMLASLLYGPFPSRSSTDLKRAPGMATETFYDDLFVADVEDWPPEEPLAGRPVVADLESILQASSPISWQERFYLSTQKVLMLSFAKLGTVLLDAFSIFLLYNVHICPQQLDPGSSAALLCKASSRSCEPCRGIGVARGRPERGPFFCTAKEYMHRTNIRGPEVQLFFVFFFNCFYRKIRSQENRPTGSPGRLL